MMTRKTKTRKHTAACVSFLLSLLCIQNTTFAQSTSKTVEDGGTGAYKAMMLSEESLPTHTIFRPADLSAFGEDEKLPVIAWGNGACANSPGGHINFLNEVASHGFLVVAIGSVDESEGGPQRERSTSSQLVDAINWAFAQNGDQQSAYYQKIDTSEVAVSGMSCGGLQTLEVAPDSRVTTVGVFNSGILPTPNGGMPGMPSLEKRQLEKIHAPTLYMLGGESDIAYNNGMDDFKRINHVPVFVANLDVGHGGTYMEPHGGKYATVATAWYQWQLKGDQEAAKMFTGETPGISKIEGWRYDKKNID